MSVWDWPLSLKPVEQTFFVETVSARFAAALTGQVQVSARPADAWRADLTVCATPEAARALAAAFAGRHGSARLVLVPAFGRLTGTGTLASFDTYTAEIGETWFDDGHGFADDGGTLPLTEDGAAVVGGDGDGVIVFAPGLALASEDGAELRLGGETALSVEPPELRAFHEGTGRPVVIGGCLHRLVLGGCRPFAMGVLGVGDLVQTSPGRGHLVVAAATADADGLVVIPIAPRLREPPEAGPPCTDGVRILMRLVDGDVGAEPVEPPGRATFTVSLIEAV